MKNHSIVIVRAKTENSQTLRYILNFLPIEYSADISKFTNAQGRICAKPCTAGFCKKDGEVCVEQAETDPICECPGKTPTL